MHCRHGHAGHAARAQPLTRPAARDPARCGACAVQSKLGVLGGYDGPSHPEHAQLTEPGNYASIESDCVFLGMAALEDPPRPEVRDAIDECTLAGIRVRAPLLFAPPQTRAGRRLLLSAGLHGSLSRQQLIVTSPLDQGLTSAPWPTLG